LINFNCNSIIYTKLQEVVSGIWVRKIVPREAKSKRDGGVGFWIV
jgi:hypothetical protein